MRIGARTIKTGLVVALTVFLINILETRLDLLEYNIAGMAAVTAIIGMKPSIQGSLHTFKNRVVATFIGILVALGLAYSLGLNAFCLGLGSIGIILICLRLGLDESIRFALVTLVAVGTYHNNFNPAGVIYRVVGILMGLIISTGINIVFLPPDYTEKLKIKINDLRLKLEGLLEMVIGDLLRKEKVSKEIMKNKRQMIRDELDDTRDIYTLLLEDIWFKKAKELKKYRRAINALQSNLERIMALHRSIVFSPEGEQYEELRQGLSGYLGSLLAWHRQIYDSVLLRKDYQVMEESVNLEGIKEGIVNLIKTGEEESVFEFYNIYFEATRINEKLEQLQSEFQLQA